MKFGIFYELQLPKPWAATTSTTLIQHALDQVELADRLGYDFAGRWSTTSWRSTATPRRRRCSWPPPASARRTSGSATASCSSPPTTRRGWPSGSARSTSSATGRVELGIGEGSSITELHPFDRRFRDKRDIWEDAVRCLLPMFWERAGSTTASTSTSRCAT